MRVVTVTWAVCSVVVGAVGVAGCSGEAGRVGTQITALTSAPDKQANTPDNRDLDGVLDGDVYLFARE